MFMVAVVCSLLIKYTPAPPRVPLINDPTTVCDKTPAPSIVKPSSIMPADILVTVRICLLSAILKLKLPTNSAPGL